MLQNSNRGFWKTASARVALLLIPAVFTIAVSGQRIPPDDSDLDKIIQQLNEIEDLSTACAVSSCPDTDRAAMQKLLDDLESLQLFARLTALWISRLPGYEETAAMQRRVTKLRGLYKEIRNLIFDESDDNASLMRCAVKLNEARDPANPAPLIEFNNHRGRERLPQWVWESVHMIGSSPDLDTTDEPEKAKEALGALDATIPEVAARLKQPTIGTAVTGLELSKAAYEQGELIELNYRLSPCDRSVRFLLLREGEATEGGFDARSAVSYRDASDEITGSVQLRGPPRGGRYEVRVLDRGSGELLPAVKTLTVLGYRSTGFPGIYRIRQSSNNAEIGSHFAIVTDGNGDHYWGSVFQNPVSGAWQFSARNFGPDPSGSALVGKAALTGQDLRIVRSYASCSANGKKVPVLSELILNDGTSTISSRAQVWTCAGGEPVIEDGEWAPEFQAERVAGTPPAFPGK